MATPRTRHEVFALIQEELQEREIFDHNAGKKFISEKIQHNNQQFPFMRNAKPIDYYDWHFENIRKVMNERHQEQEAAAKTTPEEFFDAAYEFDRSETSVPPGDTKLGRLLRTEFVQPIPLGKVYGQTMLWLIPGPASLPLSEINAQDFTLFGAAPTNAGAIKYPDGHPSYAYEEGGAMFQWYIDPTEDGILRRWWPLGWIAYKNGEKYDRTGHVLVMDMDDKHNRDRHPWIVLASEWPDTSEEGEDPDEFTIKAQQPARRDDPNVHGILPTDTSRTPVAKLVYLEEKNADYSTTFLKQLGPNFQFGLLRKGNREVRLTARFLEYHPNLAHVTGWYWDSTAKEEVCYAENGVEFMRYKPETGKYRHLHLNAVPMDGQFASWGEVSPAIVSTPPQSPLDTAPSKSFVPLRARLSSDMNELHSAPVVPPERQRSVTSGFGSET